MQTVISWCLCQNRIHLMAWSVHASCLYEDQFSVAANACCIVTLTLLSMFVLKHCRYTEAEVRELMLACASDWLWCALVCRRPLQPSWQSGCVMWLLFWEAARGQPSRGLGFVGLLRFFHHCQSSVTVGCAELWTTASKTIWLCSDESLLFVGCSVWFLLRCRTWFWSWILPSFRFFCFSGTFHK